MDNPQQNMDPSSADRHKADLAKLPGQTSSNLLIFAMKTGWWVSLFMATAFFFLLLIVWISGPEMTRGITNGLFRITIENITIEALEAIKIVYIRVFLLLSIICCIFALFMKYMTRLVIRGRDAAHLARQLSSGK